MFDLLIVDRRTGIPFNIKPRKDSQGFEIVDDYFPDSGLFHNPILAINYYVCRIIHGCRLNPVS